MEENVYTLAFFERQPYYVVDLDTGAISHAGEGEERAPEQPGSWKRVNREELFRLKPELEQRYEQLKRELGETGAAP